MNSGLEKTMKQALVVFISILVGLLLPSAQAFSSNATILPLQSSMGVYTRSGWLNHNVDVFKVGGVNCEDYQIESLHPTHPPFMLDGCDPGGSDEVWYYNKSGDTRPAVEGTYVYRLLKMIDGQSVQIAQLEDHLVPYSLPQVSGLSVSTNGTTLTASWNPLPDANNYRLRVRDTTTSANLYQIRTAEIHDDRVTASIPPGILEPNTSGKYYIEIEANRERMFFDRDNTSRTRYGQSGNVITTENTSQAPYIEKIPGAGVQTWNTPPDKPLVGFWLPIYDAQGGDTIASVTVTLPDGKSMPLFKDIVSGPKAEYLGEVYGVPLAGTYRFAVTDTDGNSCWLEQQLNSLPIAAVKAATVEVSDSNQSWQALHEAVIIGDSFSVRWDRVDDAAAYEVKFTNEWKNSIYSFNVLQPDPSSGPPSLTLPSGIFRDGCSAFVRIRALREYWEDYPKNISTSQWLSHAASLSFRTHSGSHTPQIDLADQGAALISHPSPTDAQTTEYAFEAWVRVTDEDGVPGNIASVHMLTPSAQAIPLYLDTKESASTGYYNYFERIEDLSKFQSGTYSFIVTDHNGNQSTVTDVFTNNPLQPVRLVKPSNGQTLSGNVNVEWLPVTGATGYKVRFYDSWWESSFTSPRLTEPRYTLPAGSITDFGLHALRVSAWREDTSATDGDNFAATGGYMNAFPYFFLRDGSTKANISGTLMLLLND